MNNQHSIPVNRVASRVISKGVQYNPKIEIKNHWDAPKQSHIVKNPTPDFQDFTNVKFGRFTVIGKRKKVNSKERNNIFSLGWVLRCSCGKYESKTASYIKKNINNDESMCAECLDLFQLKLIDKARNYGIKEILPDSFKQYIGKYFGPYKVIDTPFNIHNFKSDVIQNQWLVLCHCGNKFILSTKKLQKAQYLGTSFCEICNEIQRKKDKEFYEIHGAWPHQINSAM